MAFVTGGPASVISVIVPVFNVEPYLQKCVESILGQTYRNLEVILVDDGSTDSCPVLCDVFALSDKRVKVIHRENGGLSCARNTGMEAASGEYLAFADSDDRILPQMYKTILGAMEATGTEIVMCSYSVENAGGVHLPEPDIRQWLGTGEEYLKSTGLTCNYAWNKLFRRQLFDGIRFPAGKAYEDVFIMHDIFRKAKTVSVIPDALYVYRRRTESISNSFISRARIDFLEALTIRLKTLLAADAPENVILYYANAIFGIWFEYAKADKFKDRFIADGCKKYYAEFRSVTKGISGSWTFPHKVKLAALRIHPLLYRLVYGRTRSIKAFVIKWNKCMWRFRHGK